MTSTPSSPSDPPQWIGDGSPRRRRHSVWAVVGVALAVTLGVLGLIVVACGALLVIGLNNWGNNK
jgi:hypothetical protein